MINILIADHQPLLRKGLKEVLPIKACRKYTEWCKKRWASAFNRKGTGCFI
ncbi:MAG: hypothetical protein ACOX4V_11645 [Anaerovoracaceae bacterium]